jgi:hypothetical protein
LIDIGKVDSKSATPTGINSQNFPKMLKIQQVRARILRALQASPKDGMSAQEIVSATGLPAVFLFAWLFEMEQENLLKSALTDCGGDHKRRRIYHLTKLSKAPSKPVS